MCTLLCCAEDDCTTQWVVKFIRQVFQHFLNPLLRILNPADKQRKSNNKRKLVKT